jgi:excisionase family DNA binding protein
MAGAGVQQRYYSISQAAAVLGVSRVSIWRWINAGHIHAARLGHRTVRIQGEDLDRLIEQRLGDRANSANSARSADGAAPTSHWASMSANDHFAQFYELEQVLLDSVSQYIGVALEARDAGIVIASSAHLASIEERLTASGLDVEAARAEERYLSLDASATLALFMVKNKPDPKRFHEIVGGAIDRAGQGGRRVRAFGEMVAILASEGKYSAAVQLEGLWNELGRDRAFSLFCAYPLELFTGQDLSGVLNEVASTHQHVIPTESYTGLEVAERMREIVSLQQKARSLEAEIAQRQAAEEQLRLALLAEQTARQAAEDALRQRDEFVSVASHELKTPLTTLSGYAQLILRRFSRDGEIDSERVLPALQSISAQADRLSRLLGHLLDISRFDEGKLRLERQPTDVVALVEQAVTLARTWSERHSLLVAAPAALEATIDALRLEQVLTNLLDNAVKYSPNGGRIEVVVGQRRGALQISVRDHGLGIPPENRGQIFERFYQAHSDGRSGLGLGLYITRQIVELHGGSIRAEFPRGGGTRFVVTMPLRAHAMPRQIAAD